LNKFLWKPKKYASGTKMNYIGLKKPEDRASIIAYMRTLSASPVALPSAAEISAEAPKEDATEEAAE
ncbi:MAG: cytochrome c family protein, partial [Pseudomonadota bacterium]|nr:cytochrome c family protein [Pseudomonadota bacterium]